MDRRQSACYVSENLAKIVNATEFEIPFTNFSIVEEETIGSGHFSVVRKGIFASGEVVAVKELIIFNRKSIIREMYVLKAVQRVKNVVKLIGITGTAEHPKLIYTFHNSNDHSYENISLADFRWWLQTLLGTVAEIHESGVIHHDIKLRNIITNFDSRELALIDFGLSHFHDPGVERNPKAGCFRVKAPELALEMTAFDCAIDMWAVGIACLDLMIGMRYKWNMRTNTELRDKLVKSFGSEAWNSFAEKYNPNFTVASFPAGDIFDWAMPGPYPLVTKQSFDLVRCFLTLDPADRITARDALRHPFFHNQIIR